MFVTDVSGALSLPGRDQASPFPSVGGNVGATRGPDDLDQALQAWRARARARDRRGADGEVRKRRGLVSFQAMEL